MKRILITHNEGLVYIDTPKGSGAGTSVEKALDKIDPDIPADKLLACSEVLEGLLGPPEHSTVHTGVVDG